MQDVDLVLTTRELSRLINLFGIKFSELPEEQFDPALGLTSGSGDIFAASGGVMESALRTAYHLLTGQDLKELDFKEVRGIEGVKEATVEIEGLAIRVAVANTLANARLLAEKVRKGEAIWHFIEVMACPGGCVGGGGQIHGFETERIRKRIHVDLQGGEDAGRAPVVQERADPGALPGFPRQARFARGARAAAHPLRAQGAADLNRARRRRVGPGQGRLRTGRNREEMTGVQAADRG